MYQKMVNLILPNGQKDNYVITYDKTQPLTTKEKVDILVKLNDKGWSIKHVIDELSDVDWEQYLEQTLYETDELKLHSRVKPYLQSSVMSGSDEAGAPEQSDLTDEGESTKSSGKNDS